MYYTFQIIIPWKWLDASYVFKANYVTKDKIGMRQLPSIRINKLDTGNDLEKSCRITIINQVNPIRVIGVPM